MGSPSGYGSDEVIVGKRAGRTSLYEEGERLVDDLLDRDGAGELGHWLGQLSEVRFHPLASRPGIWSLVGLAGCSGGGQAGRADGSLR